VIRLSGFADEAADGIDGQISVMKALGWKGIELRSIDGVNAHDLGEPEFDRVRRALDKAGMEVNCLGSTIANWGKRVDEDFAASMATVERAIARMKSLGTKFVRIMSYLPGANEFVTPEIVFDHVREVTKRFLDAGIQPVHENCMNYGGMSYEHTLRLLGECPGLKLVFDTGNPVINPDRLGGKPWPRQNAWQFWTQVRNYVAHIHIKDAKWNEETGKETYTWPGEGDGCVKRILEDAIRHGYDGGISIEPHMAAVFHDPQARTAPAGAAWANFVEYGRRLENLIEEAAKSVTQAVSP